MNATPVASAGPLQEPVTLAELKEYMRVDTNDEDDLIRSLGVAAREWVEQWTGRALIQQTWDNFWVTWQDPFIVSRSLLSTVTHVKYQDGDNAQQTLGTSIYSVDTDSTPGKVHLAYQQTYPTNLTVPNSIVIRFVAGYGLTTDDVPEAVKAAIKMLANDRFQNRECSMESGASASAAQALLYNYRVHGVDWNA